MADTEDNNVIEVSAIVSKPKSLIMHVVYHKSHIEHRFTYGDLGDLHLNDGLMSLLEMQITFVHLWSKGHLDETSIRTSVTEALIDVSEAEDYLNAENNLISYLFKQSESVIETFMVSTTHVILFLNFSTLFFCLNQTRDFSSRCSHRRKF